MATSAHCAFCFETLAASFDRRPALKLNQVEELWVRYAQQYGLVEEQDEEEENEDMPEADADTDEQARPAAISRLLDKPSASSSSSSLPSTKSASSASPTDTSGAGTPATSSSSRTSLFSLGRSQRKQPEEYPLFVTWNTISRNGHKSLRGCIGTFEAQELEHGLHSYALTSAFEDVRFSPIPASLLPSLSTHVTLLTNFSRPSKDAMDWILGKHGIRISFTNNGRRYGSTYLPDVAKEQGWTKEEAVVSLMRKAGWQGSSRDWQRTWSQGRGELITYEGRQVGLYYPEWKAWRDWVDRECSKDNTTR